MISVEEASYLIDQNSFPNQEIETLSVSSSLGRVLAKSLKAPLSLPNFRQSAMDGYALSLHKDLSYAVVGEVQAGDRSNLELKPGECVRIFTGAAVPDSADTVVIQEKVKRIESGIWLDSLPKVGQNIRAIGSQVKAGSQCLDKGQLLNPAGLGFIQSLGIESVEVFKKPKVSIIITGNELTPPGSPLKPGKIYESNSILLKSALQQKGITPEMITQTKDSLEDTLAAIEQAEQKSDVVLISGGISVGDYDFVGKALENKNVKTIFYKVKQRPGKPLFFGQKDTTFFFALPGNPASTLSCFYVYVIPLLDRLMGLETTGLNRIKLPIAHSYRSDEPRALFLKAWIQNEKVSILDSQNSSMLISFAKANALVYIPEEGVNLKALDLVEILLLPNGLIH
jgi:molybdopterin molybdotransferase